MTKTPRGQVIPPGGYHFIDVSSGTEIKVEGYSFADTAANVLKLRLANGRPPGEPLRELYEYICGNWPHFCVDDNPPQIPHAGGPEPISRRCAAWMGQFLSYGSDPGVPQAEAERRANICLDCPKNVSYNTGGCGACTSAIDKGSFIYRRGRTTVHDAKIGACDVTAEHIQTTVWSSKLPPPPDASKLPGYCWRKA